MKSPFCTHRMVLYPHVPGTTHILMVYTTHLWQNWVWFLVQYCVTRSTVFNGLVQGKIDWNPHPV